MKIIAIVLSLALPLTAWAQYEGDGSDGTPRPSTEPTTVRQLSDNALWFMLHWVDAGYDMPSEPDTIFTWDQYFVAVPDRKWQKWDLVIFLDKDAKDDTDFSYGLAIDDGADDSGRVAIMQQMGSGMMMMYAVDISKVKGFIRPKKKLNQKQAFTFPTHPPKICLSF